MLSKEFYRNAEKPFSVEDIYVRLGSKNKDGTAALPVFYLIADAVRRRLDLACSVEGASWDYDFQIISSPSELVACNIDNKALAVKATITIRINGNQISRSSIGEEVFGTANGQEVYKSAETDAFKRAAARFGIGGYLRSLKKMWFPLNGNFFADESAIIVEKVYKASSIVAVSEEFQEAELIADALDAKIKEAAPSLKTPCPFLEREFCAQFEQKNNLKAGSWWTIGKVFGVPVRKFYSSEIEMLARSIVRTGVSEENFVSALVLSKAVVPSLKYPDYFGTA